LDLVYSQSDTLYYMIPNAPHFSNNPTNISREPSLVLDAKNTSSPSQTSKVNAVQSSSSLQIRVNKKNKVKSKIYSNQQDTPKSVDTQPIRKHSIYGVIPTHLWMIPSV
jgi:hypothetical protein